MAEVQTTGPTPAEARPVKKTEFKMDRSGLVYIKNSKSKGVHRVVPSTLPVWLARGWEIATPEESTPQTYAVKVDTESNTGTVVPVKE